MCSLIGVLLAATPLAAQDSSSAAGTGSEQKAPRRLLVVLEKGGLAPYSTDEMIILRRSFLTALADRDDAPTAIDFGSRPFPGSIGDRNKVARAAGADCWMVLRISGLGGSPSLNVQSYDLLYNLKTLDFSASRSEGFVMADIFRERWDDVIPSLLKKYPPLVSHVYDRGPPAPVPLTLRAVPGTVITGLSSSPVRVGADGTATVSLPSPAPYSFRAAATGYLPVRMSVYLDGPTELRISQDRSPWLRLDAAFLDGFFPGAAATFSLPSLPFFARLGYTSFRAGIAVNQDQITVSLPLSQVTLLLGIYLSPEDAGVRWYTGLGPLLRVSLPPGGGLTVDALVPAGLQVVGGLEIPLFGKLRTFLEYAPTVYYTPQSDLFKASFGEGNGTSPYFVVSPKVAIQPVEMRIGLRMGL